MNSSGTGVDKGLVSILQPQQSVCTWYLRSLDASQVLSTAISIPYMEKGMFLLLVKGYQLCLLQVNYEMKCWPFRGGILTWCKHDGDARNSFEMGWKLLVSLLNWELCIGCTVWSCHDFSLRVEKCCACVSGPILDCSETTCVVCRTRTDNFMCSASRLCLQIHHEKSSKTSAMHV